MKKLSCLIISIVILIIFVILGILAFKFEWIHFGDTKNGAASTENTTSQTWSVPCRSSANTSTTTSFEGFNAKVYVAEIPTGDDNYYPDLEVSTLRTFSIAAFDAEEPPYSAFVNVDTVDFEAALLDTEFQLCNEDNMSTSALETLSTGNEIMGSTSYLHGAKARIPTEPGNYRFDGYASIDGEEYLLGQIDLVFTE